MNDETAEIVSFTLYQRHINLLDRVNKDNRAAALRTILDSIQNGEEQTTRRQRLDNSIMYACIGLLSLIISYLFNNPLPRIVSIGLGVFLFAYGIIGGMEHKIRRTITRERTS